MIIIKSSRNMVWTGTEWKNMPAKAKPFKTLSFAQNVIEDKIKRGIWRTQDQYIIEIFWSRILQKYVTIPED